MDLLCSGRGAIRLPSRSTGAPGLAPNERGQGGLSAPPAPRGGPGPHQDGEAGSLLLLLGSCPCRSPEWLVATPGEAGAPSFPLLPGAGEGAGASTGASGSPIAWHGHILPARGAAGSPPAAEIFQLLLGSWQCCSAPAVAAQQAAQAAASKPCRGAQQERCRCASTRTRTGSGAERWQTPALIKRPWRELALPACPHGTELGKDAARAGTWARSWRGAIGAGSAPATP